MRVEVTFFSYLRDWTSATPLLMELPEGTTVGALHELLMARYPKLGAMRHSTLLAVGVEYRPCEHVLLEGDTIALFPPVQGG